MSGDPEEAGATGLKKGVGQDMFRAEGTTFGLLCVQKSPKRTGGKGVQEKVLDL